MRAKKCEKNKYDNIIKKLREYEYYLNNILKDEYYFT